MRLRDLFRKKKKEPIRLSDELCADFLQGFDVVVPQMMEADFVDQLVAYIRRNMKPITQKEVDAMHKKCNVPQPNLFIEGHPEFKVYRRDTTKMESLLILCSLPRNLRSINFVSKWLSPKRRAELVDYLLEISDMNKEFVL